MSRPAREENVVTEDSSATAGPALVELQEVTRRYDAVGAVTVLDRVDLRVTREDVSGGAGRVGHGA